MFLIQINKLVIEVTALNLLLFICLSAFLNTILKDTTILQEVLFSIAQNETFANAWADHVMDSIQQTLIKVSLKS